MVEIKSVIWTLVATCRHLEHFMKIKQQALRNISSSRMTWQNLSALSSIEWTQLNNNDSHQSISSKPLIEDEQAHQTVTPNFAYIYACSSTM